MEAYFLDFAARGLTTLVEALLVGGAAGGVLALVRKIQLKLGVKDSGKEHRPLA